MSARTVTLNKQWAIETTDHPKLTNQQWNLAGLVGVVLIIMAVLQLVSFTDFKTALGLMGLDSPATWAVGLVIAELAAAVGFFKLPLSALMRWVSATLALAVSGFWFVMALKLVTVGGEGRLKGSGFFGRFLEQMPGWWTVIEATIFLFLVLYAVELLKDNFTSSKRRK